MNILITNVHSALNLGDDAIMHETLRALEKTFPNAKITVAANDPESWRKYKHITVVDSLCNWAADCKNGRFRAHLYLTPVYIILLFLYMLVYRLTEQKLQIRKFGQHQLLAAYYQADLVLSCGGGNFYAHKSISPALFWGLMTLAFPIGLGKKVVMLPQSVGPIKGWGQKAFGRLVFNRVSLIMARESITQDFLERTLKLKKHPLLLADLAFSLPNLEASPYSLDEDHHLHIGATIIDRSAQNKAFDRQSIYEDTIVNLLAQIHAELGAAIYLFVQCYGPSKDQDDRHVASRLYTRLQERGVRVYLLDQFSDPICLKATYQQMDLVIATRMHTGIFALSNAVPTFLIGYQPKSKGMIKYFDLEKYCCEIEQVSEKELYKLLMEMIHNRETISQQIKERYAQMQSLLGKWVEYLVA